MNVQIPTIFRGGGGGGAVGGIKNASSEQGVTNW